MKILLSILLAAVAIAATGVNAQTGATSPAVTVPVIPVAPPEREETTGTITDITPGRSVVLHTGTNAGEPVVFRFAPQVTYVDDEGKIVEAAGLRKNLRVRLSFIKVSGDNVVDKVTILQ